MGGSILYTIYNIQYLVFGIWGGFFVGCYIFSKECPLACFSRYIDRLINLGLEFVVIGSDVSNFCIGVSDVFFEDFESFFEFAGLCLDPGELSESVFGLCCKFLALVGLE